MTDKRGVTFGYGDFGLGVQDFIIRPRTIRCDARLEDALSRWSHWFASSDYRYC